MEMFFTAVFGAIALIALLWSTSHDSDENGSTRSETAEDEERIVEVPCGNCGEPMRWKIGKSGFGSIMPLFKCVRCVNEDLRSW